MFEEIAKEWNASSLIQIKIISELLAKCESLHKQNASLIEKNSTLQRQFGEAIAMLDKSQHFVKMAERVCELIDFPKDMSIDQLEKHFHESFVKISGRNER